MRDLCCCVGGCSARVLGWCVSGRRSGCMRGVVVRLWRCGWWCGLGPRAGRGVWAGRIVSRYIYGLWPCVWRTGRVDAGSRVRIRAVLWCRGVAMLHAGVVCSSGGLGVPGGGTLGMHIRPCTWVCLLAVVCCVWVAPGCVGRCASLVCMDVGALSRTVCLCGC